MSRPPGRGYALGLLALSVLLVGTVWVVPYLPTNDGPEHVLAVHIENHFGDPGTIYRDVFQPAPEFAGRGFTILFEPLEDLLGWRRGLQVALSIILLTEAWGFVALVRAVDPRRWPLAFLGFPLALSWTLYMGFFPFTLASGVGLFILAFALRPSAPVRRVGLAALLLLQGFLHVFAAFLTGFVIAVIAVVGAPRGRRLLELGKVCLVGLPAASLAIAAAVVARRDAVEVPFAGSFDFGSLHDTLLSAPQTFVPGPLTRALIVVLCLVGAAGLAAVRAVRRDTPAVDRSFSIAALVFLLTATFAPTTIPGWQAFSQRFVSLGVVMVIVAIPFERLSATRTRAATGLAALTFAGAAAWLGASYPFHRRLAATYADAIDGLSANVTRHGSFLPVTFEVVAPPNVPYGSVEVPMLAPLLHIASLYATVEGGLSPYTFATNGASWPFTLRPDGPLPGPVPTVDRYVGQLRMPEFRTDPAFRARQVNELTLFGMFYEGVLLTGARPEDLAIWRRRGYVADWEQGSVMVGHFEPCRIDVVVRGSADAPVPLLDGGIDVPVAGPMFQNVRPPPSRDAEGLHLVVESGPCGRVWVRPHWDTPPEVAGGQPGVTFCANAGPMGMIAASITRKHGEVVCTGMGRGVDAP